MPKGYIHEVTQEALALRTIHGQMKPSYRKLGSSGGESPKSTKKRPNTDRRAQFRLKGLRLTKVQGKLHLRLLGKEVRGPMRAVR